MYLNEIATKEVNHYYAIRGGKRTTNVHNFANYMGNAIAKNGSAIRLNAIGHKQTDAMTGTETAAGSLSGRRTAADNSVQKNAAQQTNNTAYANSNPTDTAQSQNTCCDKCELTNQLLQMMSRNLYSQNLFGSSTVGSGALAAYQSMAKYFGTGLFS